MKSKTSWGPVAEWYDNLIEQSPDSFQAKVILPNLLRIIDPKKGMSIFDIACGQGYFARAFHEKGAAVVGADISKELIELARKNSPADITYHVAAAEKLSNIVNAGPKHISVRRDIYDIALIVLAIQNIEDMKAAFIEASKILKPGGRFVLVINHPVFRIPGKTSWVWDEAGKAQYRRVDAYMSDSRTEIDMNPGKTAKAALDKAGTKTPQNQTISFHRPLQSYFKALSAAGFSVTRLEEWISHKQSQTGSRAAEEDRIRKEIPMFMCLECGR